MNSVKLLFIFLDGIGLGKDDPETNPFARASMPNLVEILGGCKIISNGSGEGNKSDPIVANTTYATLMAVDACLGTQGVPQSATGQASLLTGKNVPRWLGYHDGPKPIPSIVEFLHRGTLLTALRQQGKEAALLNAFPPRYFESIEAGFRIPGVIALSVQQAGIPINTMADLFQGKAISADFTAEGWRSHLGYQNTPLLTMAEAGKRLKMLTDKKDLAIFEYWLTDMAGHHQDMQSACALLEAFDEVMGGLFMEWDHENGLILMTSDHGNLEDLSTRHHTRNHVPLLLVGSSKLRDLFIQQLMIRCEARSKPDLADIAPAIQSLFEENLFS